MYVPWNIKHRNTYTVGNTLLEAQIIPAEWCLQEPAFQNAYDHTLPYRISLQPSIFLN